MVTAGRKAPALRSMRSWPKRSAAFGVYSCAVVALVALLGVMDLACGGGRAILPTAPGDRISPSAGPAGPISPTLRPSSTSLTHSSALVVFLMAPRGGTATRGF